MAVPQGPKSRTLVEGITEVETWQTKVREEACPCRSPQRKDLLPVSSLQTSEPTARKQGWLGRVRQEANLPGQFSPAWKSQLLVPTFGRAGTDTHTSVHTQARTHACTEGAVKTTAY